MRVRVRVCVHFLSDLSKSSYRFVKTGFCEMPVSSMRFCVYKQSQSLVSRETTFGGSKRSFSRGICIYFRQDADGCVRPQGSFKYAAGHPPTKEEEKKTADADCGSFIIVVETLTVSGEQRLGDSHTHSITEKDTQTRLCTFYLCNLTNVGVI